MKYMIDLVLIVLPGITKIPLPTPLLLVRRVPLGIQAALALPRALSADAMPAKGLQVRVPIAPRDITK